MPDETAAAPSPPSASKERAPTVPLKQKLEGAFLGGIDTLRIAITKLGVDDCRRALRSVIKATADTDEKTALVALYRALYPAAADPTGKGLIGLRESLSVSNNGTVHFSGIPLGAKSSTKEDKVKMSKQIARTAEGFVCAIVAVDKASITTQKMNDGRECVVIVPPPPAAPVPPLA